jgi:predicted nucleotide-binding protein
MALNLTVHEVAERMDRPVRDIVNRLQALGIAVERGSDELLPEEIQAMLVGKPPVQRLKTPTRERSVDTLREPSVFDQKSSFASRDLAVPSAADLDLVHLLRAFVGQAAVNGITSSGPRTQVASTDEVFVVHGHDDFRHTVEAYIRSLSLRPVLLDSRPNQGRTIIEKLEAHANTSFAVVLLTPDDQGRKCGTTRFKFRARQNVVLELGFFLGRLGRHRVCALYVPGVELPSDFHGVLYIELDADGKWRKQLHREFTAAHLPVWLG